MSKPNHKNVYVITAIDGEKQYVRRKLISSSGRGVVTMVTKNRLKAFDFGSIEKATSFKDKIGIGYAIEIG